MAATRLRRVGGRDDDLLHHVPLHLVRHGVRRHAIVAGGARNPDPTAGDVDDAVENAATVAALLAAEKADKEKKLESFRRDLRRRVAARVAAERGDSARHTANIALAVARDTPADACERRTGKSREASEEAREQTPLARLLRSARDAARESHRSVLATFTPAAFGGDRRSLSRLRSGRHRDSRGRDDAASYDRRASRRRGEPAPAREERAGRRGGGAESGGVAANAYARTSRGALGRRRRRDKSSRGRPR
jgi:hypothetical protein